MTVEQFIADLDELVEAVCKGFHCELGARIVIGLVTGMNCLAPVSRFRSLLLILFAAAAQCLAAPPQDDWSDPKKLYTIAGLPQHEFYFDATYKDGKLIPLRFAGTIGYIIQPSGTVDRDRRWVWISPLWLGLRAPPGNVSHRYYVESLLAAGFHVVGLDVGTTCGSPAGAELYDRFYTEVLMREYHLNPRARMIGQSNGGLISYAWAFRHPNRVERIFGILPATDLRSWPGLDKVAGSSLVPNPPNRSPGRITPEGLAFPVATVEELKGRLAEFNPIDNLGPLAKAGVKILHVHGDKDTLVPMNLNSEELVRRYRELGGEAELEVLNGLGHGGQQFYHSERGMRFLLR